MAALGFLLLVAAGAVVAVAALANSGADHMVDNFTVFGDWTNITRKTFRQDFTSQRNNAPLAEFVRYRRYDESTVSLGLRFRFGK